jgi:hypothetical protein
MIGRNSDRTTRNEFNPTDSAGFNLVLVGVASEARKLLGDRASEWMVTPSRLLDGMTPAELARSPEGARVVLHELRRASGAVQVTTSLRQRGRKASSSLRVAILALGALIAAAPRAAADHDVYPPGWNKPEPNLPAPMFEFRPGWDWNDSQRYWPDQVTPGAPASRPLTDAPVIFGMVPGGHRYHRLQ